MEKETPLSNEHITPNKISTSKEKPTQKQVRSWKQITRENSRGTWTVFPDLCKGCGLCIEKCPTQVLYWSEELGFMGTPAVKARIEDCIVCGQCETVCPEPAIRVERKSPKEIPPFQVV